MISATGPSNLYMIIENDGCRVFAEEIRRKIVNLLRPGELTISEVAKKLRMTPQATYHHLKKLEEAGLIKVTRKELKGHLLQSYYRTTAQNFVSCTKKPKEKTQEERLEDILSGLSEMGLKIEVDKAKLKRLVDIRKKQGELVKLRSPANEICKRCGSADFFFKSGPVDLLELDHIYYYASLLIMTDEEYEEKVKLERKLRQCLKSICRSRLSNDRIRLSR